ncbi:hypothetical protein P8452_38198 [Trifolium repens]|nr:hypothetical protein P8452_38198 [Trifolium repens]
MFLLLNMEGRNVHTNEFQNPNVNRGKLPMINDISTVVISNDDGYDLNEQMDYEPGLCYEQMMPNNDTNNDNIYKGPTTVVFDHEQSIHQSESDKYFTAINYRKSYVQLFETPGKSGSRKSSLTSPPSTSGVKNQRRSRILSAAGSSVQKHFKCKFRPTMDMRLSPEEAKMCAYTFRDDVQSIIELIYYVGNHFAIRSEFESFIPRGYIGRSIIKMTALRITWNQRDALMGMSTEKIGNNLQARLDACFQTLKLIYFPIEEEESGHWFLKVIHVEERQIYHLDSYLLWRKLMLDNNK